MGFTHQTDGLLESAEQIKGASSLMCMTTVCLYVAVFDPADSTAKLRLQLLCVNVFCCIRYLHFLSQFCKLSVNLARYQPAKVMRVYAAFHTQL